MQTLREPNMKNVIINTSRLNICSPSFADQEAFLIQVQQSKEAHAPWVNPPNNTEAFYQYIENSMLPNMAFFLVKEKITNKLVGVVNLSHIVEGFFQSSFMGFYRFSGFEKQGYMTEALIAIVNYVFYQMGLHRIEANIQPANLRSERLVKACGFVLEGFSKNYLKINGKWCDHNRFAITKEAVQDFYIEKANARKEPWLADFNLSLEEAKLQISQVFTHQITNIKLLAEGWDNYAYLVNDVYLFRMPRRYIAIPLIEKENAILSLLKDKVELAIPTPEFCGFGNCDYPYPIQGYKKIAGQPAEYLNLSTNKRCQSIQTFATFLKMLHSIPLQVLYENDIGPQVFDRTNKEDMFKKFQLRLEKLAQVYCLSFKQDEIKKLLQQAATGELSNEMHCLVHGDLYCRHFIFEDERLKGAIDWGDAGINHFVVDLAALYSFFPDEAHQTFFDTYGDVSVLVKNYAKFLGAYSAIACLDYALETKNAALEKEAKFSLEMQGLV